MRRRAADARLVVRNAHETSLVEAFVIVAVATVLLTRAHLEPTDCPQVGGGSLHIGHAL